MANFRDKSDECFNEPRYSCLCEAFRDFGVSIPKMSGKMAEAVMDDFFELLNKKNKGEPSKDEPKEHPYSSTVEFQEYGLRCIEVAETIATSEDEAYKKIMEEYKNKSLAECKVVKLPDYMLNEVKNRMRVKEIFKRVQQ